MAKQRDAFAVWHIELSSRFKIQELYLTTVKTHQDTYYKQLHKQNYKYKKNIYIYVTLENLLSMSAVGTKVYVI